MDLAGKEFGSLLIRVAGVGHSRKETHFHTPCRVAWMGVIYSCYQKDDKNDTIRQESVADDAVAVGFSATSWTHLAVVVLCLAHARPVRVVDAVVMAVGAALLDSIDQVFLAL
jgi:hypothetical protein